MSTETSSGFRTGDVVYPNTNWLDPSGTAGALYNNYYVQTYPWSGWWLTQSTTKLQLKLSEVEILREVARKDKKVKEILNKFAPFIEIEVDF